MSDFRKRIKVEVGDMQDIKVYKTERNYKEKVFDDLAITLGKSVTEHAKTREDGFEGLEMLNNFYKMTEDYDKIVKLLKEISPITSIEIATELINTAGKLGVKKVIRNLKELEREER